MKYACIAPVRNDGQAGLDGGPEPSRVVEVVMRDDQVSEPFSLHQPIGQGYRRFGAAA